MYDNENMSMSMSNIFRVSYHYTICFTERTCYNHKNTKEDYGKVKVLNNLRQHVLSIALTCSFHC